MTWTGLCGQCGHDRAEHHPTTAGTRAEPDAERILRCHVCSCVVTDDGDPWPPPEVAGQVP